MSVITEETRECRGCGSATVNLVNSALCACGTHNICRMCTDVLQEQTEGHYDGSLCKDCEEFLITDAVPVPLIRELYFSTLEVLDNLADAEEDLDADGVMLEDIRRLHTAVEAIKPNMLRVQKAPDIE